MKRDQSEPSVVEVLEKGGWQVFKIFILNGPDLIALKDQRAVFIECKTGKAGLTDGQLEFHQDWQGPPITVMRSQDDALAFLRDWDMHVRLSQFS